MKSFAIDKRFDVIVSGSMLGIIMHEVSSFPVGYVEKLHMRSYKERIDNIITLISEKSTYTNVDANVCYLPEDVTSIISP